MAGFFSTKCSLRKITCPRARVFAICHISSERGVPVGNATQTAGTFAYCEKLRHSRTYGRPANGPENRAIHEKRQSRFTCLRHARQRSLKRPYGKHQAKIFALNLEGITRSLTKRALYRSAEKLDIIELGGSYDQRESARETYGRHYSSSKEYAVLQKIEVVREEKKPVTPNALRNL